MLAALGSIGPYLSLKYSDSSLFTSVDGGITWHQSLKGPWLFTSSPHGDLLAAVPIQRKTKLVKASTDWGRNWTEVTIVTDNRSEGVYVIEMNSLCDLRSKCHRFKLVISDQTYFKFQKTATEIEIDISQTLNLRNCSGLDKPDVVNSDFEKFYPHESPDSNCKV